MKLLQRVAKIKTLLDTIYNRGDEARPRSENGDQEATLRYLGSQKAEPIAFNPNAY
jgi:hypothetical protein